MSDRLKRRVKEFVRSVRPEDRFHFVRDYRKLVRTLIDRHPYDEAMSLAVGGNYASTGTLLADILIDEGLRDGNALMDLGCGSGRLASALGPRVSLKYLGYDIVPELLEYARSKSPDGYEFRLNHSRRLPAESASFDFVAAFSVFTHLLHEESYLYVQDAQRVLRPGGKLVFSFLEFQVEHHWSVFEQTVEATRNDTLPHLNVFIEQSTIELWAAHLGFETPVFVQPGEAGAAGRLGQSVATLRKPADSDR